MAILNSSIINGVLRAPIIKSDTITATSSISGGQLISGAAQGTAPFVVSSNTKVDNLNADYLDGYSGAHTANANYYVLRNASGESNVTAVNLCTVNTSTSNAKISYDSTTESIKFIFA